MPRKEMIAMLLAGGQGSRLGALTKTKAKPAVLFGGKYRLIDFPMSNCINSGVDTVGVLTQYQPTSLNRHIGIGVPWDLDRKNGGVTVLTPHVKAGDAGEWYSGSGNAIYQNIDFIDSYNPKYVLVLSGDHIYKMDYAKMLDFHKQNKCDATIPVLEVPWDEASRYGIMNVNPDGNIYEFEEKPKEPKSNLASMGIYIFTWSVLRDALIADNAVHADSDFGRHIIPHILGNGGKLYAYRFKDYWKDVGTIESYWEANMDLINTVPEFNLYDDFCKIYTDSDHQPPAYTAGEVKTSLLSEGCEVYGNVFHSVLGTGVVIEEGAIVRDSILMANCRVGRNTIIERCVIDENNIVGDNVIMGHGDDTVNADKPAIYNTGITVTGEGTVIPDNVTIGKNCCVYGVTTREHYAGGALASGGTIMVEREAAR